MARDMFANDTRLFQDDHWLSCKAILANMFDSSANLRELIRDRGEDVLLAD
jgi:hypothetical protein